MQDTFHHHMFPDIVELPVPSTFSQTCKNKHASLCQTELRMLYGSI